MLLELENSTQRALILGFACQLAMVSRSAIHGINSMASVDLF